MKEFLIFAVILWIPPILVIIKNVIWNLLYWHKSEYLAENLYNYFRWDHNFNNRNLWLYFIKYCLFGLAVLIFVSPIAALAGALFAYCIWIFEIFRLLGQLIYKSFVSYRILSPRPLAILGLLIIILLFLFWLISFPFLVLNRSTDLDVTFLTLSAQNTIYLLDAFVFIGISCSVLLFLDIIAPLLTLILVTITGLFVGGFNRINLFFLEERLKAQKRKPEIIVISGSNNVGLIADLLPMLIGKNTKTINLTAHNLPNVINFILDKAEDTFIITIDSKNLAYSTKRFLSEITPEIFILEDINQNFLENIADRIDPSVNLVLLNENAEIQTLFSSLFANATIVSSIEKSDDNLSIRSKKVTKDRLEIEYCEPGKDKIGFTINTPRIETGMLVGTTLYASTLLGYDLNNTVKQIEKINFKPLNWEIVNGDYGTKLIYPPKFSYSINGFMETVNYACNFLSYKRLIAITDGFERLGSDKNKKYTNLLLFLNDKIDFLLTTDPFLGSANPIDFSFKVIYLTDLNDAIYWIRENSKDDDLVLFEGPNTQKAINRLSSSLVK